MLTELTLPHTFISLTQEETSDEATGGTSTAEATSREDTIIFHADTLGKKTDKQTIDSEHGTTLVSARCTLHFKFTDVTSSGQRSKARLGKGKPEWPKWPFWLKRV